MLNIEWILHKEKTLYSVITDNYGRLFKLFEYKNESWKRPVRICSMSTVKISSAQLCIGVEDIIDVFFFWKLPLKYKAQKYLDTYRYFKIIVYSLYSTSKGSFFYLRLLKNKPLCLTVFKFWGVVKSIFKSSTQTLDS